MVHSGSWYSSSICHIYNNFIFAYNIYTIVNSSCKNIIKNIIRFIVTENNDLNHSFLCNNILMTSVDCNTRYMNIVNIINECNLNHNTIDRSVLKFCITFLWILNRQYSINVRDIVLNYKRRISVISHPLTMLTIKPTE